MEDVTPYEGADIRSDRYVVIGIINIEGRRVRSDTTIQTREDVKYILYSKIRQRPISVTE